MNEEITCCDKHDPPLTLIYGPPEDQPCEHLAEMVRKLKAAHDADYTYWRGRRDGERAAFTRLADIMEEKAGAVRSNAKRKAMRDLAAICRTADAERQKQFEKKTEAP